VPFRSNKDLILDTQCLEQGSQCSRIVSNVRKFSRPRTAFNTTVCDLKEAEVLNLREIIRQSAVERLRIEKAIADNNFLSVSVRHCGSY